MRVLCLESKRDVKKGIIYTVLNTMNNFYFIKNNWYSKIRFTSVEEGAVNGTIVFRATCPRCGNIVETPGVCRVECPTCLMSIKIYTEEI